MLHLDLILDFTHTLNFSAYNHNNIATLLHSHYANLLHSYHANLLHRDWVKGCNTVLVTFNITRL